MTALHKDLADSERHEPKGASTATAGQVLIADGAGGTSWQAAPGGTPDPHAPSHLPGGSDPIDLATGVTGGLMSAADKTKLDGIEAGAEVNDVPATRTITAGIGLTGGGDLSADRTIDLAVGAISVTDNFGGQALGGAFTAIQFDTLDFNTGGGDFTFTPTSSDITVNNAGLYLVTYGISISKSGGTARGNSVANLFINGSVVDRSASKGYHRTVATGEDVVSQTILLNLSASDVISVRAALLNGSGPLVTVGSETNLCIARLS